MMGKTSALKKWIKNSMFIVLSLTTVTAGIMAYVLTWPEFGGKFEGARAERMIQSKHYHDDKFFNVPENLPFDLAANFKDLMGFAFGVKLNGVSLGEYEVIKRN